MHVDIDTEDVNVMGGGVVEEVKVTWDRRAQTTPSTSVAHDEVGSDFVSRVACKTRPLLCKKS